MCVASKQQASEVEETPSPIAHDKSPVAGVSTTTVDTVPVVAAPAPRTVPVAESLPQENKAAISKLPDELAQPLPSSTVQSDPEAVLPAPVTPEAPVVAEGVAKPELVSPSFEPPPVLAAEAAPASSDTPVAGDVAAAAAGSSPVAVPPAPPAVAILRMPGNRAPEIKEDPAKSALKKDEVEVPGWACHADEASQEWLCDLRGADPAGAAHVVAEEGSEPEARWAESKYITDQDELRMSQLLAKLPANPWDLSCKRPRSQFTPASVFVMSGEDSLLRQRSPLEIDADKAEMVEGELSTYIGNALLRRADQNLYADLVSYNGKSANLNALKNVFYLEKGVSFASSTAFMRMDSDQSVLRNAQYILETVPARGTARVAYMDSKTQQRYENATLTGCPVGNQDWVVHAEKAQIDKEANVGELHNTWMEVGGIPIGWSPYYSFPLDDRRKSGFLTPAVGYNKMNGMGLMLPYYLNLAPNYDATVTLREQTTRGVAGRGQFRYLTEYGSGLVEGEITPYDKNVQSQNEAAIAANGSGATQLPTTRWVFNANNTSQITDKLKSQAQIFRVSDQNYFQDYGNYLTLATATSYARSFGNLVYSDQLGTIGSMSAFGMIDTYQQINNYVQQGALYTVPYSRVPQLMFNTSIPLVDEKGNGFSFQSATEAVNFMNNSQISVNGASNPSAITTGYRLNMRPFVTYNYATPYAYSTSKLALQYTQYQLTNEQTWSTTGPSSISRFAPILSVDNGLFFDNDFNVGDAPIRQTLEPRLYYLYIPRINQQNIPIFDTMSYDVNYWQLFRDNRFTGVDRMADSNQFTLGLTSRTINDENGLSLLTLKLAQTYYLEDQTVQMNSPGQGQLSVPGQPIYGIATRKYSNLIGELTSQITPDWALKSSMQWDPSPSSPTIVCAPTTNGNYQYPGETSSSPYPGQGKVIPRYQFGLRYNNRRNDLLNISYLYLGNPNCGTQIATNQSDISFRLPLFDNWHVLAEWAYSLNYKATAQTYFGLDKETCCWRFSILYWQYLNGTASSVPNSQSGASLAVDCSVPNTAGCPTSTWTIFFNVTFKGLTEMDMGIDNFLFQRMPGFRRESEL